MPICSDVYSKFNSRKTKKKNIHDLEELLKLRQKIINEDILDDPKILEFEDEKKNKVKKFFDLFIFYFIL